MCGLAALAVSCASTPKNTLVDESGSSEAPVLRSKDDRELAQKVLSEICKDYPVVADHDVQLYVSNLGRKVAKPRAIEASTEAYSFSFTTVQGMERSTMSLPPAMIFVSSKALKDVKEEGELAQLLSREIAHVILGHSAQKISTLRQKDKSWNDVGGGLLGGVIGYGIGKMATANAEAPKTPAEKYKFLYATPEEEAQAQAKAGEILAQSGFKDLQKSSKEFLRIKKVVDELDAPPAVKK